MICCDSRDQAILDVLRAAGSAGLSPKEIHLEVRRYSLKYHRITRRIKLMNKRMQNEIGERIADKVGRNWALSGFMFHNWSVRIDELEKCTLACAVDRRKTCAKSKMFIQ
jgi:hypothetical protein